MVTESILIPYRELHFSFVRSSGPGGQNVNKLATACQLRFDLRNSPSLTEEMRERLYRIARNRINREGILVIDARRFRTQEGNRQDALQRLLKLLQRASRPPVRRVPTRPPAASVRLRLQLKKQRGEIKQGRRRIDSDEE
ncbi:aminoacyl-tRNA hydrolase [bacterium]|nr:aminoacyl-tRNA hydrolase [bacterium]